MRDRLPFVAGSTGAVGRTLVALAREKGIAVVPHVRPRHASTDPSVASFELTDRAALASALARTTTIVQLIGTMRRRFASGDTYESSDIGTTAALAEAGREAGVDHFVLLSSVGAGSPRGAYLKAKARAESIVRDSGIPFTIVRPSSFEGEGHRPPPGMRVVTRALGLRRFEPIRVDDLAATILHVTLERAPLGAVLEGETLWAAVEEARRRFA
jgi:uncharacterized protein YbjT (DUF2867 family)